MGRLSDAAMSGHYPGTPGYRDEATSKAAANAVAGSAEELRRRCLSVLPGTAEDVAKRLDLRRDQVAPRLTELTKESPPRAIKTKERGLLSTGLTGAIYKRNEAGHENADAC